MEICKQIRWPIPQIGMLSRTNTQMEAEKLPDSLWLGLKMHFGPHQTEAHM